MIRHVIKIFLPLYLLAYFASAFFWRSFTVWKQTGINPVVFKQTDSAHDFIGRVFKILCNDRDRGVGLLVLAEWISILRAHRMA